MIAQDTVHRWKLSMPGGNLGFGEMEVSIDHLQSCMAQYFLKRVDIPAIKQVINGEGVSTKMGMQTGDTRLLF